MMNKRGIYFILCIFFNQLRDIIYLHVQVIYYRIPGMFNILIIRDFQYVQLCLVSFKVIINRRKFSTVRVHLYCYSRITLGVENFILSSEDSKHGAGEAAGGGRDRRGVRSLLPDPDGLHRGPSSRLQLQRPRYPSPLSQSERGGFRESVPLTLLSSSQQISRWGKGVSIF
jgi:hypothetical protein